MLFRSLGFALTIWDQIFHRAVFPTEETIRTDTGLPGRPLIVEQATPRPHHLSVFAAQLVAPFRPMYDLTKLPSFRPRTRRSGDAAHQPSPGEEPPVLLSTRDTAEECEVA